MWIASMPRHTDAVFHAKGGPTKYLVHIREHIFLEGNPFFLLVVFDILMLFRYCLDTEFWVFLYKINTQWLEIFHLVSNESI